MRPGLLHHRKFARLARLIGSEPLALGSLEMLWAVSYENGDDLLGDAGDVEHLARWAGEAGKLAAAMVESGFLDASPEGLRVHDLWDHAPAYVTKRATKEAERVERGETIRSLRSKAGKQGAAKRWQMDGKRNPLATDSMANELPPAPAPAPAPSTDRNLAADGAAAPVLRLAMGGTEQPSKQPKLSPPKPPTDPRFAPLRAAWEAEFVAAKGGEYRWQGAKDAKGVHALIAIPVDQFRDRARRGLKATGFASCATVAELASKWNHLAGTGPPGKSTRGLTEVGQDWDAKPW